MVTLWAASLLQGFGDLLVGGLVLSLAVYGVQNGLFLATLAGLHALASFVVALAFAAPLAELLVSFELPAVYAFPAAFGLLLAAAAVGIRLAVGEYVPADVVRFVPAVDKLGGGVVGAMAGMIVAGTFLVAMSVAPVPAQFRIDGSLLRYDMGTRLLRTFARCVEPDDARRAILLDGEPGKVPPPVTVPEPPSPGATTAAAGHDAAGTPAARERNGDAAPEPPPAPPVTLHWSEPFADTNGNRSYDDGEPYLDTDHDKKFTARLVLDDPSGNGVRDIGLLERYRLHAWGKEAMSVVAVDEAMNVAPAPPPPPPSTAAPVAPPPLKKKKRP